MFSASLKLFFQIDDDFTRSYVSRQLGEMETTRQTRSGSQSQSTSDSFTEGNSSSFTDGHSTSRRPILHMRTSKQTSSGHSDSRSTSRSRGSSASTTEGWGEAVHKRPLLNPDEIGRMLARQDDRRHRRYPGLVLALVPGEHPLLARRVNYFESPRFIGYFDPHPNHPPPPTLAELAAIARAAERRAAEQLEFVPPPRQRLSRSVILKRVFWAGVVAFIAIVALRGHIFGNNPSPTNSDTAKPTVTLSPSSPPRERPKFQVLPEPEINPLYAQGAAEWRTWQAWFDAQPADRHAGADYWATNRGERSRKSCADASEDYSDNPAMASLFERGCLDAQSRLNAIDTRRADPQYKAGFNDAAKLAAPTANSQSGAERYATVATINLNLRAGPAPDFASVATLPEGTKVKVLKDADNGWQELEVSRGGGDPLHGFANSKFLTPAP